MPLVEIGRPRCGADARGRMPDRRPAPGEQYRFHVDMDLCIGCKCCVVACNEQNGNPATVNWRRVAEIEAGAFPDTQRAYFSMGCNHCADPTCLAGCPVDAYTKDDATGIVRHSAETCIGCQYCTWTCSYGVPQFDSTRGVVGKCDMCHGRLSLGQAPACVSACPEGALAIEIVRLADWRASVSNGDPRDGAPMADSSTSTTRVTLPTTLLAVEGAARPARLAEPHFPLVVMTVLSQWSVGALAATWLAGLAGSIAHARDAVVAATVVCAVALGIALLHLGRPVRAYRALKMWRRSWLSREALLFTAYLHVAAVYAAALSISSGAATAIGAVAVLLGLSAVMASARIYLVPSRPAWNSGRTVVHFFLTGALLGVLFTVATGNAPAAGWRGVVVALSLGIAGITALAQHQHRRAGVIELRATAALVDTALAHVVRWRFALLALGGVALPLLSAAPSVMTLALAFAIAGELLGRYVFFASAVPKHMTAPYVAARRAA
jgi:Fe-S-cluster-containing dehydrogenase component/DMSO reductase anchor subunit